MSKTVLHKRSVVVENNGPKLPTSAQMQYGEIAINYAKGYETLSIRNNQDEIVTFSSYDQIKKMLDDSELVIAASLNDLNSRINEIRANTISTEESFANVTTSGKVVDALVLKTVIEDNELNTAAAINNIYGKLDDIATVSGDVQTISGNVATVSGDVQTVSGNIQTISGNVETISATTENINKELSEINSETDAEFKYRQTGDGDLDKNKVGVAKLEKIKGKSLVWNQIIDTVNEQWAGYDGSVVVSNGEIEYTASAEGYNMIYFNKPDFKKDGRKYYISVDLKGSVNLNPFVAFNDAQNIISLGAVAAGAYKSVSAIFTSTASSERFELHSYGFSSGDKMYAKNIMMIDLTLLYGPEIDGLTDAEILAKFEAEFPLAYYDYNASTLINNAATGIETVGFNQWDEEWEVGNLSTTDGSEVTDTNNIRSDFIRAVPNASYYIKSPKYLRFWWYDGAKNALSYTVAANGSIQVAPANAVYFRFGTTSAYGPIYNYNICINLSDPSRNGQYEPHWKEEKMFNITTKTGKKDGVGESVVIFPDGLKSAGSVYDEIGEGYAIKRVGEIDLGSLDWSYDSGNKTGKPYFLAAFSGSHYLNKNLTCQRYPSSYADEIVGLANKTIRRDYQALNGLYVKDTDYTDAATFQSAINGVKLYYPLNTPEYYVLAEPLTLTYKVDSLGTEKSLPEDTSSVVTAPFRADIKYALNSLDVAEKMDIISSKAINDLHDKVDENEYLTTQAITQLESRIRELETALAGVEQILASI